MADGDTPQVAASELAAGATALPSVAPDVVAPPASDAAPAVSQSVAAEIVPAETKPDAAPQTLLGAAEGKPKDAKPADAETKPDPKADGKPDSPAPADKPDVKAKTEGKPDAKADGKKDEATDPASEATADAQPPAPVKYEAFKVPDGVKLDDKKLEQFTEVIGTAGLKQDDAQKLIDLYVAERKSDAETLRNEQRKVWDTLNDTWKTDLRKDTTLGGNRLETSLSMAKAVMEEYGGNQDQVRELIAHIDNNGMGNYPGFVRMLHNIGKALNIFEDGMVPAQGAPKPQKGPGQRGWYPSMGNGAAQP